VFRIETHVELPDDWEHQVAIAAFDQVLNEYRRLLGSLRCHEHGEGVTVVVEGRSVTEMNLALKYCCDSLHDEANVCLQSEGLTE
jgi:hypothetical protein